MSIRIAIAILSCCLLGACSIIQKSQISRAPSKNPCIVLALPDSGPYAAISSKIRKGAQISRNQLAQNGINARIENINTEAPNWLSQLAGLPEECAIVGGPMREQSYLAAEKAGLLEKRAFFAFMPNLPGDEGQRAWRFFPGPQDQIDALVNFTAKDLGIRSFGSFYPADQYGNRMTRLLEETLASRGMTLQKASYDPKAASGWNISAESLVHPQKHAGRQPIPQTTFEAVLLPDSWKHADRLTSSFLLNGEDRLVLMGTTLWEQGLSGKQVPMAQKYELAIFPGAWNKSRAPQALQGNSDFWTALGYDFVRFATHMGLAERLTARDVTDAARQASSSIQAMAPITYDAGGKARQKLYLFQITPSGMAPLTSPKDFQEKRRLIRQNTSTRIQSILSEPVTPAIDASEEEKPGHETIPATSEESAHPRPITATHEERESRNAPAYIPPVAPQAPSPAQTPLSTVPDPSYKLRLPTKK